MPALVALLAVAAAGLSAPAAAPATAVETADRPPNVLLITSDDQTVADMRYMPYTRKLIGRQGVTFSDAISPYPLCCPARATLLTGMFNHNTGVINNKPPYGGYQALRDGPYAEKTLPTWLQKTYQTTFTGKYLNGFGAQDPTEVPAGWEYFAGGVDGMYQPYGQTTNVNGEVVPPTGEYTPYANQRVVESRITEAHDAREPFFIWQSEVAPHTSCWPNGDGTCRPGMPMPAREDRGRFATMPLPARLDPSFDERAMADKPSTVRFQRPIGDRKLDWITRLHRARAESLQAVDRNVRDSVEHLASMQRTDGTTELDHTLIIFTSDNGFLLGHHRTVGKVLPYEESLRVPLLMRGPGVPVDEQVSETATLVDLAPTIADAADVKPLVPQDGRSLLPVATGDRPGWRTTPLEAGLEDPTGPDQWLYRGVRTDRYVFLRYPQTDELELYDLLRDPNQMDNLAYRPTHRAVRAALAEKLRVLRDCAGAACGAVGAGGVPAPNSDRTPVHPDELVSIGRATQVVTVTARTWRTGRGTAVAWEKVGRSWRVARGPFGVTLGEDGMIRPGRPRHMAGETPAGTFSPARAMGFRPDPGTALSYRRLDGNDHLPHDPEYPATYNVFQPFRPKTGRWAADLSERFADRRARYPHAVVMNHNLPRRIGFNTWFRERVAREPANVRQGSFLLHAGRRVGRRGWVSMPTDQLAWLMGWMRPERQRTTFVVGPPSFLRSRL
ncbi:MAG: sulfatase-like hydrolase/transferase [Nocardioidaceae bacterium]